MGLSELWMILLRLKAALTNLGKLAGFWLSYVFDRINRRPANYCIHLKNLYRMEAHWLLTFAKFGTVHFSLEALQHLRTCLDLRSYFQVLRRSRRLVGSNTVRVIEEGDDATPYLRCVRVSDDYYGKIVTGEFFYYPYVMHPWVYALGLHKRVVALRRSPRRFRLFFSGVVNEGYSDRFDFPIMTRPEVVECVLETFRADACVVASRSDLATLRRTDRPIVLVVFRGDVTPMASNHFLPRERYLRMLAGSRFALCPPGVFMPHSHNLIEAMAVGTIPLINYPEFCRPTLTVGENCLAFSTPEQLCDAVRRALSAPEGEVQAMREAVSRHYDEELSPEGAARKLAGFLAQAGPESRLVVNREFMAARLWSRKNAPGR